MDLCLEWDILGEPNSEVHCSRGSGPEELLDVLTLAICFSLQLHLPEELASDPDVKFMAVSPPVSEIRGRQKRLLTFAACRCCAGRGDGSLAALISAC